MSFTQTPLEEDHGKKLKEVITRTFFSHEYNPGKVILPEVYGHVLQDILDLKLKKDDVIMASYPRTGSTWCQEIVWILVNKLDFKTAKEVQQMERAPMIEMYAFFGINKKKWEGHPLKQITHLQSPRCLRTHSTYALLPKEVETIKPKIVYTMRNPKDQFCSFYAMLSTVFGLTASFEETAELYLQNKLPFGGFFDHVFEYWNRRHQSNIFVIAYEDMLEDTRKAIKDIANFLGVPITKEQIEEVYEYVVFDNMKNNDAVNYKKEMNEINKDDNTKEDFIRKGKSGGWKTKMSPELSKKFDDWIEANTKGTDLSFKYD